MLELENVHTYYGTSHILQGVSFKTKKGKCISLLGRNGVGKTTTLHTISGLHPSREGKIKFLGEEIQAKSPHKISRMGIGLVPQGRRIFPSLTIRENLLIGQQKSRFNNNKSWNLEKIYELFPILKEREKKMGTQLSGGQQQMLAIGRALLTDPQLLIMDEPSEGLAPVIIDHVGDTINELKKDGLSIFIVEQNISLACNVADEIFIMNKGQIVWTGTPEELMANEEIQRMYLGL